MRNLTMMTDLYELTMMNGFFLSGKGEQEAVFDVFFRQKEEMNYAIFAGLEQAIDYIKNLAFTKDDIKYLKSLKLFDEKFIEYLEKFKFTGDIYSVREGEVVFPQEPIITVKAPIMQAQLIEPALLNIICHQTLIATKTSRIVYAAGDKPVIEFGLRRAQGPDAGIYGARASVIGGCKGTSNVLSGQMFDIPLKGTLAHSFVMSFDSEIEAFRAFAKAYPDGCLLLVDTYDSIKGLENAITVFKELRASGHEPLGIRLDSGDLAYLSKVARKMLDDAGFPKAVVLASCDLDEKLVVSLKAQNAKIDTYCVGTKLITSEDMPSLGGVYKLAAIEENGALSPRMKISDSSVKVTNPDFKTVFRLYDKKSGKAVADLITLKDEVPTPPLLLRHETERYKTMYLEDFDCRDMKVKVFEKGKCVYDSPTLKEIAAYSASEKDRFWEEYMRLDNPHVYKVDLSDALYDEKQTLLRQHRKHVN